MGLIFLKVLDSLAASLRAFSPAKIREWRRLVVAFGFVVIVVVIAIVLLALVFIYVVSELVLHPVDEVAGWIPLVRAR